VGAHVRRKALEKNFRRSPPLFLALKVHLVVLVSAFATVILVSFLFAVFLLMHPRVQPFVKVGSTCPVPYGVGD